MITRDPDVLAVEGSTMMWNPSITEERARTIVPDPDEFSREILARPSADEGTAYVTEHVDWSFVLPNHAQYEWHRPILLLDPAESVNSFVFMVGSWGKPLARRVGMETTFQDQHGTTFRTGAVDRWGRPVYLEPPTRPLFHALAVGGWDGPTVASMGMDRVVASLASTAKQYGCDTILSDQRGGPYLASMFSAHPHRLRFRSFAGSNDEIHEAVTYVRALMRDKQIAIVNHDGMRRDLRTYPRRIAGGKFKYGGRARGSHHWDYASLWTTFGLAAIEERGTPADKTGFQFDGAPARQPTGYRTIVSGAGTFPVLPPGLPTRITGT